MLIKSVYDNQHDILRSIIELHCPGGFEVDVTYSIGAFYRDISEPKYKFDLEPSSENVIPADSGSIPLDVCSVNSVIFDPPFLTYIKKKDNESIMGKRFSGYWTYGELEDHYQRSIKEAYRILRRRGIFVVLKDEGGVNEKQSRGI